MAQDARPATAWNEWLWAYVASEDLAALQRLLLDKADELPLHDVFVANGLDSTALEPSRDLVARFRPALLPMAEGLKGHDAFFDTRKAQAIGWRPEHTWRAYL